MSDTSRLVERLVAVGYPEEFVRASLPDWWTPEQGATTSGKTLVSLLLARRLGLDPETLLDDNVPVGFLHTGPTKFKHLRLGPGLQREALTAYSQGVARIVMAARRGVESESRHVPSALELRRQVLETGSDYVGFGDVLTVCWALNIPVLHLRMFPAATKGVTAMAIRAGQGHVILVARDTGVEAQYMFHVAHELGHISLGHMRDTVAIIDAETQDLDDPNVRSLLSDKASAVDEEEQAADAYAQELLTGSKSFNVDRLTLATSQGSGTAAELAARALASGRELGVDPGHIVMCFGNTTKEWALAQSAAKLLPQQPERPGTMVNKALWDQLKGIPDEQSAAFLRAVAPA
jgi:hypothetical protein